MVAPIAARRWRADDFIKAFFGSNALIAIVVLGSSPSFFSAKVSDFSGRICATSGLYRRAGLEYVDIMRDAANAHAALSRGLNLTRKSAQATESAETLARFDQFSAAFSDSADDLNGLVSDAGEKAVALRDALALQAGDVDRGGEKEGHASAAPVDEAATISALRANTTTFAAISSTMAEKIRGLLKRHRHSKTRKRSGYSITGRKESRTISQFCPRRRKSCSRGIPLLQCQPTARSPAFFSVEIGSPRAFGRIGTESFRCWLGRSWSRSSRLPSPCPSASPRLFT